MTTRQSPYRLKTPKSTAAVALACLVSGCAVAFECGSWQFTGTPQSTPGIEDSDSFPLMSAFTFTPATCSSTCNVSTDAMIQMVLVYDQDNSIFLYPTSSYQARAAADGWVIDRVDGEGEGWYGLLNDGSTFTPFWNTTGANNTPNTLFDDPGGWPNNIIFYAVDAAVCFKSETCSNKILGYYLWSYTVDNDANAKAFFIDPPFQGDETAFQGALASWNAWAPGSGTEAGCCGLDSTVLPHAVLFPALSDL
jgi:hypothetical protein